MMSLALTRELTMSRIHRVIAAGLIAVFCVCACTLSALAEPETVSFPSADGKTQLVGYLFKPDGAGPHPAIVLLHGRAGPYSANNNADCNFVAQGASSACNASTLSKRHAMWGRYWADHGFVALLPDSFGPRGKARGFGRFSHGDAERDDVNERTVRPLDAEGAFAYLNGRRDVVAGRIYLQGWSNGGSTALNVMIRQGAASGFRAALIFYPGCGASALLAPAISTTARLAMFLAEDDEEVSPDFCLKLAERSRAGGTAIDVTLYPRATHDFDDPGERRQSSRGNQTAKADAMAKAVAIVEAVGK